MLLDKDYIHARLADAPLRGRRRRRHMRAAVAVAVTLAAPPGEVGDRTCQEYWRATARGGGL